MFLYLLLTIKQDGVLVLYNLFAGLDTIQLLPKTLIVFRALLLVGHRLGGGSSTYKYLTVLPGISVCRKLYGTIENVRKP